MKISRKCLTILMAVIMLVAAYPIRTLAVSQTEQMLHDAEQEKQETEGKLDETKEDLNNLNDQKDTLEGQLSNLNSELSKVSDNLSDLEQKISDKEAEIDETNANIDQANADLEEATRIRDEQYELMKKQVQFLYERNDSLYMEIVLSSFTLGGFSDFINKNDYIEKLADYEKRTLEKYIDTQNQIQAKTEELAAEMAKLESEMAELDEYKAEVVAEQGRVSGLVSQTSNSITATQGQIADAEAAAEAYEAQIKEQEKNIAALRAQLAEEQRMTRLAAASSWRDISEVTFADDDRYLLANLIYCEAGNQPYEGQVGVGAVVINRVLSSVYPDTVVGVIYQNKQFSPVGSGRLAIALANNSASAACYSAADAAMSGITTVSNCLYFRTPVEGVTPRYVIGGHIFY